MHTLKLSHTYLLFYIWQWMCTICFSGNLESSSLKDSSDWALLILEDSARAKGGTDF